jgi:hypothetical protein
MTDTKNKEQWEQEYGYEKDFVIPLPSVDILGSALSENKKSSPSFVEKLFSKSNACIYKVYAKDAEGKWASFFILTNELKGSLLKKEFSNEKDEAVDLKQFGNVIASYYGETMPEDVKQMLIKEYDCLSE